MPAGGLWAINAEVNGQPGRGFQLEVENGVMIFTYYGYRGDGTSVFYLAAGPVVSGYTGALQTVSFSAPLQEYQNGKVLGQATKSAESLSSPGNVSIVFSGGKNGTITFPGESPQAISKFGFGYPANPDGLIGSTFLFTYLGSSGIIFGESQALTVNLNSSSSAGNGMVANAAMNFVCENGIGTNAGVVVCADSRGLSSDDTYLFRISGDRGAGVGTWKSASTTYPLNVVRTANKNGIPTGLNDGTVNTLKTQASLAITGSTDSTADALIRASFITNSQSSQLSLKDENLIHEWGASIRSTLESIKQSGWSSVQ
jgi:hypothetical protein